MKLLGFAVAWAGYVLMWWGFSSIQGPGVGIMDLVTPGRVPTHSSTTGGPNAPAGGISSGALQPATSAQVGGPLGVGVFLPNTISGPTPLVGGAIGGAGQQ